MIFPSSEKTKIKQERHLELVFKASSKKRFAVLYDSRCSCRDPHQGLFWLECCNLSLVWNWCTVLHSYEQCTLTVRIQTLMLWWFLTDPTSCSCPHTCREWERWNINNSRLPLLLHRPTPGLFHLQTDRQIKQSMCRERIEVLCPVDGIVANRNCTLMTVWVKPYN